MWGKVLLGFVVFFISQVKGSYFNQNPWGFPHGMAKYGNPMLGGGYPMSGAGYPMSGAGYPMSGAGYPKSGAGYPMFGAGYPMSGGGYPMSGAGYPMFGGAYPMFGGAYPMYGGVYPLHGHYGQQKHSGFGNRGSRYRRSTDNSKSPDDVPAIKTGFRRIPPPPPPPKTKLDFTGISPVFRQIPASEVSNYGEIPSMRKPSVPEAYADFGSRSAVPMRQTSKRKSRPRKLQNYGEVSSTDLIGIDPDYHHSIPPEDDDQDYHHQELEHHHGHPVFRRLDHFQHDNHLDNLDFMHHDDHLDSTEYMRRGSRIDDSDYRHEVLFNNFERYLGQDEEQDDRERHDNGHHDHLYRPIEHAELDFDHEPAQYIPPSKIDQHLHDKYWADQINEYATDDEADYDDEPLLHAFSEPAHHQDYHDDDEELKEHILRRSIIPDSVFDHPRPLIPNRSKTFHGRYSPDRHFSPSHVYGYTHFPIRKSLKSFQARNRLHEPILHRAPAHSLHAWKSKEFSRKRGESTDFLFRNEDY